MRRLFPVTDETAARSLRRGRPDGVDPRRAGRRLRVPRGGRRPRGPAALAARQHGVHARRRRPARRPLAAHLHRRPTCGSSAPCGGSRTWWSSVRKRYGRRGTGRHARVTAFAARRGRRPDRAPRRRSRWSRASLDLDFSLPLFTSPLVPTLVLTGAAAAPDRIARGREGGRAGGDRRGRRRASTRPRAVRALADARAHPAADRGRAPAARPVRGGRCAGRAVSDPVPDAHRRGRAADRGRARRWRCRERFALVSLLEEDGFLFSRYRRTVERA